MVLLQERTPSGPEPLQSLSKSVDRFRFIASIVLSPVRVFLRGYKLWRCCAKSLARLHERSVLPACYIGRMGHGYCQRKSDRPESISGGDATTFSYLHHPVCEVLWWACVSRNFPGSKPSTYHPPTSNSPLGAAIGHRVKNATSQATSHFL